MKKTLLALMMLSAVAAYAGEAEDRLLSVQSVYRAALHEQNSNDSKIISLQSDLERAQRRLQAAQSDIDRLKGEIQTALAQKEQQNAKLQQAGQMLDAAWNAVYGAGGSKANQ